MTFEFGDYQLNTDTLELIHAGVIQKIEPQVFNLLNVLIEQQDKVLSRDELIDLIWQGRPMSDTVISSAIKLARRAIGDDGKSQQLIKTIHGCGFRFIGQAKRLDNNLSDGANNIAPHAEELKIELAKNSKPSILVLPFTHINLPDSLPQLSEGFACDIILGLSRLQWLKVISRATAFKLNKPDFSPQRLSEITGAKYCLSGTIEVVGSRMFLTIELNNMVEGTIIWVERIQGNIDDVHQLRTDIVQKAIGTLEVQISSHEAKIAQLKAPENLDAWSAFNLGMAHLFRFNQHDNAMSANLFERAIKLDPMYARAHAALSFTHFQNSFNRYAGCDLNRSAIAARKSAERGIELDSMDPFSNFSMGRTFWLEGDAESSLPWIARALAINPNFAQAYYAQGLATIMSNQQLASHNDASQAISLSPLDPLLYGFYGVRAFSFIAEGDYENARKWATQAARQPGALFMMDLQAAVANSLAGYDKDAQTWAARARSRKPDLNEDYFFNTLPFSQGETRNRIHSALKKCGF
jgi:TolB-like protein